VGAGAGLAPGAGAAVTPAGSVAEGEGQLGFPRLHAASTFLSNQ